MKKDTTKSFIEKSISKFGKLIDYSLVEYISSKIPVILICPIHNKFTQSPFCHLQGKAPCPKCSNGIWTTQMFIEKSINKFKDRFSYEECEYQTDAIKLRINCKLHGSFLSKPAIHLRTNNGGCQTCSFNKKSTTEEFILKANKKHNYKYDYSLVNYKNNKQYVKIICNIHGIFNQLPANHLKYGCCRCAGKYKTQQEFIEESKIIHLNKYSYSKSIYKGMFHKVEIICKIHGSFWQLPTNHLHNKRGCPKCSNRISKNEIHWLNSLNIPNDKQHRNVFIKVNNDKYYVDGFDPIKNIIYEFDGDYWHGNPKFYRKEDIHPEAKISFGQLYSRTLNKRKKLEEAGFTVISVWESDYKKNNL